MFCPEDNAFHICQHQRWKKCFVGTSDKTITVSCIFFFVTLKHPTYTKKASCSRSTALILANFACAWMARCSAGGRTALPPWRDPVEIEDHSLLAVSTFNEFSKMFSFFRSQHYNISGLQWPHLPPLPQRARQSSTNHQRRTPSPSTTPPTPRPSPPKWTRRRKPRPPPNPTIFA